MVSIFSYFFIYLHRSSLTVPNYMVLYLCEAIDVSKFINVKGWSQIFKDIPADSQMNGIMERTLR